MTISKFDYLKNLIKAKTFRLETLPDQIYKSYKCNELTYSEYRCLLYMMRLKPKDELLS